MLLGSAIVTTSKDPLLAGFLENLFGRTTAITSDVCINPPIGCGGPATEFEDQWSAREYLISGLCQKCQDQIFTIKLDDDERE